jgi:hypothetical protein
MTNPAPAKAAAPVAPVAPRQIVSREFDNEETLAMKAGQPEEPSPLLDLVNKALTTGRAQGVGYGEDYKKNTVLAHIRKAHRQLKVDASKVLRTFDRSDYVGSDGVAWPHIGFKYVDKPPAKSSGEPAPVEGAVTPTE